MGISNLSLQLDPITSSSPFCLYTGTMASFRKNGNGVAPHLPRWRTSWNIQKITTLPSPNSIFLVISVGYKHFLKSPVLISPIYGYQIYPNQVRQPEANTKSKTVPISENPLFISICRYYSTKINTGYQPKVRIHPIYGYKQQPQEKQELAIHAGFIRWCGTDPYADTRRSRCSWIPISSSW